MPVQSIGSANVILNAQYESVSSKSASDLPPAKHPRGDQSQNSHLIVFLYIVIINE